MPVIWHGTTLTAMRTVSACAVALMASTASAQTACGESTNPEDATQIEVCVVDRPRYAAELFGSGADSLELDYVDEHADPEDPDSAFSNRPKVLLELPDRGSGNDDVAVGSSTIVTVRLLGAVFGERMRASDVEARNLADGGGSLRISSREGGAAGERAVAFEIEVVGGGIGGAGEGPLTLALAMPPLTGAGDAMTSASSPGVLVQVDVESTATGPSRFPDFPARRQTLPDGPDTDAERDEDDGRRLLIRKPEATDRALTLVGAAGAEGGTIEPEERRLVFAAPRDPAFLALGVAGLALRADLSQADGTPFAVTGTRRSPGDGEGVLSVSTEGDFRAGDRLVFDLDGDGEAGEGEILAMEEGTATGDFVLEDVVPGNYEVLYFPRSGEPLRSGAIVTTFAINFDRSGNSAPPPVRQTVRLEYLNAERALAAYAINPPSDPDRANVRVSCRSSMPCEVYLACDGADGAHYFAGLDSPIDPRTTHTVTALEMMEALDAADEDFVGGMSCEVFGGDIAVQVLQRSGAVLTNTTYVGGRLERRVRELTEEAGRAAHAARGAACASIANAAARAASGCPTQ